MSRNYLSEDCTNGQRQHCMWSKDRYSLFSDAYILNLNKFFLIYCCAKFYLN